MMNMNQFKQMHDWRKQWDGFFGDNFWKGFEPMLDNVSSQVNLYKAENELLVVLSIPGLEDVDDVELFVQYQTLEARGKVNLRFKGYELVEEGIFQGEFERIVNLPYPVREDKIEASYHNGLLIVNLHRRIPDDNRKKIQVRKIEE